MGSTQDLKPARETYESFIRLIKIAAPVIALLTVLVIYLLTH